MGCRVRWGFEQVGLACGRGVMGGGVVRYLLFGFGPEWLGMDERLEPLIALR